MDFDDWSPRHWEWREHRLDHLACGMCAVSQTIFSSNARALCKLVIVTYFSGIIWLRKQYTQEREARLAQGSMHSGSPLQSTASPDMSQKPEKEASA